MSTTRLHIPETQKAQWWGPIIPKRLVDEVLGSKILLKTDSKSALKQFDLFRSYD